MENEIATWFNSWERLQSVAVGAAFFFVLTILVVRVVGKRVTSQFNNFDWIITVAVGSLAASGILLRGVSISDATIAIVILAFLQWATTWVVLRFPRISTAVKATPQLLTHKGSFLYDAMKRERITESEIVSKLRSKGYTSLEDANWVVLETDGSLSVIPRQELGFADAELMRDVSAPAGLK